MPIAQQIQCTGSFDLPCNADAAFPLFSPEGERAWIKTWNPRPVFPTSINFVPDTVFREGDGIDQAFWTIIDADWKTHRAVYVRVAPASHVAHIIVKLDPMKTDALDLDRCRVSVTYTVTAFGDQASRILEPFSDDAYRERMRNWQSQIATYLETCAAR